jgi:acyl-coenzyme A thioesterase PaaI-like protein
MVSTDGTIAKSHSHVLADEHQQQQQRELPPCFSGPPAMQQSEYEGYAVKELSVTADLIQSFLDEKEGPAGTLSSEAWVMELIHEDPQSKVVFDAHGEGQFMPQHLSTGLSGDHLFLSLLQNELIRDMVVIYTDKLLHTVLRFGVPVCGHPTIVHGGLTSATFDETFGVLLYAAGRWNHLDLEHGVFTARLEVDYKKPLPAESTIICTARIESCEGRKIWVTADITDPSRQTVYASSRALFVKPRSPVPNLAATGPAGGGAAATTAAADVH